MPLYGLIGYPLAHSFSKKYFTKKFADEKLNDCTYENFEIKNIAELKNIVAVHPTLAGLNVTVPYKTSVINLLDELDETASEINAVNTITITNGKLKGYNTDCIGFETSLKNFIGDKNVSALILGTGGSAKAVEYVLKRMSIDYLFASRKETSNIKHQTSNNISYSSLDENIISSHQLIINCTPLGRFPEVDGFPPVDYNFITKEHFLFDLNYNPEQTMFMKRGLEKNAMVKNGYEMLVLQAEAAWKIWNKKER